MRKNITTRSRRSIPAVSKLLEKVLNSVELPRPVIVDLVRREVSKLRDDRDIPDFETIIEQLRRSLEEHRRSRLQPIVNGTGVIVHTNFGRAPLGREVVETIAAIAQNYSNLEFDLASGERGHRAGYLEHNLALLCGAEAATVVNNCAAALVLIARHFTARKKEIIISRGELVQIGGGFRIGEILEAAGARLREVGATNKTTLRDYKRAINKQTALILKVHRSNFFMSGFVESPPSAEIAVLAKKNRIPFVEDLGSGAMSATDEIANALEHEPTPAEALKNNVDLVCFSGDKLFGGPQAGIITGRARFIRALKQEPIFRALRCDKLILAALQTTTDLHLQNQTASLPALKLLQTQTDELRARAAAILVRLRGLPLRTMAGPATGKVGGGSLPRSILPSITIDILPETCSLKQFADAMRKWSPPVVGYIAGERFKLDLRTIFPEQDDIVVDALRAACSINSSHS
ncbi:MAG: L-seryl-tRNA(Ser) seleniumtransferase [Verrucomicrobiota bacterium]|jgi:L-seryl-tRNA(Ser) seleniumtransferase